MRRHIRKVLITVLLIGAGLLLYSSFVTAAQGKVYSLTVKGAISPANADYFIRGLNQAIDENADIVILNLNTPGGLDKSMREMIQAILDSPIPVVVYVSPKGARAASAGTYLVYASHIAAMAPATNLGSATPVSIGVVKPLPEDKDKAAKENNRPEQNSAENHNAENHNAEKNNGEKNNGENDDELIPDNVMQHKMVNDAEAYIKSLAQLRGRNSEWAMQAVRRAANLSASDALDKNVIDLIAFDQADLIEALNDREVNLGNKTIKLTLVDPQVIEVKTDWRTDLLIIITDPSIAYLLLLAGIYGLMFEFLNPGSLLPGTTGAICLILALYALNMLPINMAGLALLTLGLLLMISEAIAPSFGILGLGGISSFVIGSFMLMDTSLPGYQIAPSLIIASGLLSAFLTIFIISMVLKARRSPVVSGADELLNQFAIALEDFEGDGRVMIRGEIWRAKASGVIKKSQKVRVVAIEGLRLKVTTED